MTPADTATGGLTAAEAVERLERGGRNELPRPPTPSRLRRFIHQLVHFFALLLLPAVLIGLGISLTTLLAGPIARQLGHAAPPALAWALVGLAPVVLVAVDAAEKRWFGTNASGSPAPGSGSRRP